MKGAEFEEAYPPCKVFVQNKVEVRYIHINHLIKAKEAAAGKEALIISNQKIINQQ